MQVLRERWVLTLAVADRDAPAGPPYVAPLYFALLEPDSLGRHAGPLLVFASDPDSRHGRLTGAGPTPVAAAVALESEAVGELRGAQLAGRLIRDDRLPEAVAEQLRARYLARHPVAEPVLASGRHRLYALQVTWGKTTDNRLGFGVHPVADFAAAWSVVDH